MGTIVLPTTPGNQPSAQQDPSRQSTPNLGCCCRTVCWKGLSSAPAGVMERTLPKAEQPLGPHPRMVDELPRARAGTRKRPGWIEDAVRGQQTRWAERKSRRDSPGSSRKSFAAGTHVSLTFVFIGRCPNIGEDLLGCHFMSTHQWGHCVGREEQYKTPGRLQLQCLECC